MSTVLSKYKSTLSLLKYMDDGQQNLKFKFNVIDGCVFYFDLVGQSIKARILVLKGSEDVSTQYMATMNCIFAAQKNVRKSRI